MKEYSKSGKVELSGMKAGIERKTARKYIKAGKLPSELCKPRHWRTHPDPFADHWKKVTDKLEIAEEFEGKFLFEWLCEQHPEKYHAGQLRTFQRHVKQWRALHGVGKEIFFPQDHVPGRIMQTDFTWLGKKEFGITIARESFVPLLCHSVLTYSNWEWATVCGSESLMALRRGFQTFVFRLGCLPAEHWTDHSTAATHEIGDGQREFNERYLAFLRHYGVKPHTIQRNSPHEQGDVESLHGALKKRLKQHLLLRGHRDFDSENDFVRFIESIMDKGNRTKHRRLAEEQARMRPLTVDPLPEYEEERPRVSKYSTIQVMKKPYSVPSRLIREQVLVRCFEERLEVYYAGVHECTMPRLRANQKHYINYRHVIDGLIRKPGAFRHYRFREDMFPTPIFRWAYDALCAACNERVADLEYLRLLQQAARTMESQVETALLMVRVRSQVPRWETVFGFLPRAKTETPVLAPFQVELREYDRLLETKEVSLV